MLVDGQDQGLAQFFRQTCDCFTHGRGPFFALQLFIGGRFFGAQVLFQTRVGFLVFHVEGDLWVTCAPPVTVADKVAGDGILVAPVPLPGQPFSSDIGYGGFRSPDILVRVDVTYLRQDFSMRLPVANAHPWPELQRFDFVVRSRVLAKKDAAFFRTVLAKAGPSPYHAAAHSALKALTGRDVEPNAAAWRTALALTKS